MVYSVKLSDGRIVPVMRDRWAIYSAKKYHLVSFFRHCPALMLNIALAELVEPVVCETTDAARVIAGLFCADTVELRAAFPGRDVRCFHAEYWFKNPHDPGANPDAYFAYQASEQAENNWRQFVNAVVWNLDCTSPLVGYDWRPN